MESNVKMLRKRQGLSQKELGEKIGVSQQVISRIENGQEEIPIDVLLRLAMYFKVTTDRVLDHQKPEERIEDWMNGKTAFSIGQEDVLMLMEKADNIPPREWLFLWFLVNVLRDRR